MEENVRSSGGLGPKQLPNLRRFLVIASIVMFIALFTGVYIFVSRLQLSRNSSDDLPITDQFGDIKGLIDQSQWRLLETRQRMRCDLVEVRQDVESIWGNIDKLDREIAKYKDVYAEVATSKKYPELLEDEFAVRYFAKDLNDPLPDVTTPAHCAERLNVLMYTVNQALATKKAAYEIEYQTRDRIHSINGAVKKALDAYCLHREFLEALRTLTAAGALPKAETLQAAAHRHRLQRALEKMGRPGALRQEHQGDSRGMRENKEDDQAASVDDSIGKLTVKDSEGGDAAASRPLVRDVVPEPYLQSQSYPWRHRAPD